MLKDNLLKLRDMELGLGKAWLYDYSDGVCIPQELRDDLMALLKELQNANPT